VKRNGVIAQLGERYNGIVEVVGSIPSGSTISDFLEFTTSVGLYVGLYYGRGAR
jgi:hypothetical protein